MNCAWLGFGVAGSAEETTIHLFPNSKNTRAKYELKAKLSIFGSMIEPSEIVVDGLTIGSPDGLRISDAFSSLKKITPKTYFGLEVTFIADQKQVDISNSEVVIEVSTKANVVSYRPKCLTKVESKSAASIFCIEDHYQLSNLLLVNKSSTQQSCILESNIKENEFQNFIVKPQSVEENTLKGIGSHQSQVSSWGNVELFSYSTSDLSEDVVAYNLCVDRKKQEIVSIEAL